MQLKQGLVIVVCFAVGGTAFATESISFDDGERIVSVPKPDLEPKIVSNAFDLRDILWKTQAAFAKISPPSDSVYNHVDKTVYALDWSNMPEELRKGLNPTMMYASDTLEEGLPAYGLRIVEEMGETVFYNARNFEVYRLSPPSEAFDSALWYRSVLGVESPMELDAWTRWVFSPEHTSVSIRAVPISLYSDFLDAQEMQAQEEALLEASMAPVMMSFQTPVTGLQLAIENTTNATVAVEIRWPSGFSNEVALFSTMSLLAPGWELACAGITTAGATNYVWEDTGSAPQKFFVAGNGELDTDFDGLPDAYEVYMYGSQTNLVDSDFDGFSDYEEVTALIPTDPVDGDISDPGVSIASPLGNVLVVP